MTEQKDYSTFDINPLVISTYNKIAEWHSESGTKGGLKELSLELIEDIAGAAFAHLGIDIKADVAMDKETREKVEKEKEVNPIIPAQLRSFMPKT